VGCTKDGHRFSVDCAEYERSCGPGGFLFSDFNACVFGPCPPDAERQCRGDVAEICSGSSGPLLRGDCGRFGWTCGEGEKGVDCVGKTSCASNTEPACDGTAIVACNGGYESRLDCAANPTKRRCVGGKCAPTGEECLLSDSPRCEDSSLSFCADGFLITLDCMDLGFSACDKGRCVPAM
jgi:hypothetical protein